VTKPVLVGIDVASRELVVAIGGGTRAVQELVFSNDSDGHRKLVRRLTKGGRRARVGLEATGVYHLDLALSLHRAKGVEVMVANPRVVRDFARASFQRSKTDRTDAGVLLAFTQRMPFEAWQPPANEILALRAISRRISALVATGAQERNRLHAAGQSNTLPAIVAEDIGEHLAHLEARIQALTREAKRVLAQHPVLQSRFDHLVSVKGIATASALRILAELSVLPADMTIRQWVAHSGLDPRQIESGTSVHRPARISRQGNRHLRAALYMPAMVAIQYEPAVQAFYNSLLARGKKPLQAIVAVMRKLLHSIYGMFEDDADFDGEKFFAIRD
jgi:transposase